MRPYILILIEVVGVLAVIQILSISPSIQIRKPVKFTQPRREGSIAMSMAILVIVVTALLKQFSFVTLTGMIPFLAFLPSLQLDRPSDFTLTTLITQTGLMALFAAPFLVHILQRKQPWLSIGLKKQMISGGLQVGFGLVLILVFLRSKVSNLIQGPYNLEVLLLLIGSLTACFISELIFRGFIQLRLMDWLGETRGWLLTAALFALWSILPVLGQPTEIILITGIYRLSMGLLLGWIARRSGGILGGWIYYTVHTWLFWL